VGPCALRLQLFIDGAPFAASAAQSCSPSSFQVLWVSDAPVKLGASALKRR